MKRLCLLLVLLGLVTVFAVGCEPTAHDRYRQMVHRRVSDADAMGFADDVDATFYFERPSHLSEWYNR
jgi:hypothetical protein